MKFKTGLKKILEGLDRKAFCSMTGVPASSLSIWLNSDVEPSETRKQRIAEALGLDPSFFGDFGGGLLEPKRESLTPKEASRMMGCGVEFVHSGLQQGVFPWGYAVNRDGNWSYWINRKKFFDVEGFKDDESGIPNTDGSVLDDLRC